MVPPTRRLRYLFSLSLIGLWGCAALPQFELPASVPDVPVIVTAHGVLPESGAAALIGGMRRHVGPTSILDRHLALMQAVTGQRLTAGNKTTLHFDGPSTYDAMREAINKAKDHVNLEVYIFEADEAGRKMADLLYEKQRDGVQVNIIYDSVGSLGAPRAFFRRLEDAGANTLEFNPINPFSVRTDWHPNQRGHRKILVVDGRVAFTGGINISNAYAKGTIGEKKWVATEKDAEAFRDTHVEIVGPVVAQFQRLFLDTWEHQRGPPLPTRDYFPRLTPVGDDLVRVVASTPENTESPIYTMYLSAIKNARTSIHLTSAYFVPGDEIVAALEEAATRGVDVKIMLPGISDSKLVLNAGRSHYARLLRSGVRIYERRDAMLHAKTAVVDGVWATVGSANLDLRSFLHNHEANASIVGVDFAEKMEAIFAHDLAHAEEIVLEQWERRSWSKRLRQRVARMWGHWL